MDMLASLNCDAAERMGLAWREKIQYLAVALMRELTLPESDYVS